MTFTKWLRQDGIGEGTKPGTTLSESTGLREAMRRVKLPDCLDRLSPIEFEATIIKSASQSARLRLSPIRAAGPSFYQSDSS